MFRTDLATDGPPVAFSARNMRFGIAGVLLLCGQIALLRCGPAISGPTWISGRAATLIELSFFFALGLAAWVLSVFGIRRDRRRFFAFVTFFIAPWSCLFVAALAFSPF